MQEGLTLAEQIGDHETMSLLLLNSGQLSSERGNVTQIEMRFQEALRLAQQPGHHEPISLLLTNLRVLASEQKDYARAEKYLQEGLALSGTSDGIGKPKTPGQCLDILIILRSFTKQLESQNILELRYIDDQICKGFPVPRCLRSPNLIKDNCNIII